MERQALALIVQALDGSGLEKTVAASTGGARAGERPGDLNTLWELEQGLWPVNPSPQPCDQLRRNPEELVMRCAQALITVASISTSCPTWPSPATPSRVAGGTWPPNQAATADHAAERLA